MLKLEGSIAEHTNQRKEDGYAKQLQQEKKNIEDGICRQIFHLEALLKHLIDYIAI